MITSPIENEEHVQLRGVLSWWFVRSQIVVETDGKPIGHA